MSCDVGELTERLENELYSFFAISPGADLNPIKGFSIRLIFVYVISFERCDCCSNAVKL